MWPPTERELVYGGPKKKRRIFHGESVEFSDVCGWGWVARVLRKRPTPRCFWWVA
jgi:hypothetical protein